MTFNGGRGLKYPFPVHIELPLQLTFSHCSVARCLSSHSDEQSQTHPLRRQRPLQMRCISYQPLSTHPRMISGSSPISNPSLSLRTDFQKSVCTSLHSSRSFVFQWVNASFLILSVCSRFRKDVRILPYRLKLSSAAQDEGDTERVRKANSQSSARFARSTIEFQ